MAGFKPLSEQTLMNNYVFSMVMREPKRIKPLLEYMDIPMRRSRLSGVAWFFCNYPVWIVFYLGRW